MSYFPTDDDDDLYDYAEAVTFMSDTIYGNVEAAAAAGGDTSGGSGSDDSGVFSATIQSLVRSGSGMRTLWCEMPKVRN